MSWNEIGRKYDNASRRATTPHFSKLSQSHIEDEEKSVRWNREFVEKQNRKYDEEKQRRVREKNEMIKEATAEAVAHIKEEVEFPISDKGAQMIWNKAYQEGHSNGWHDIEYHLVELIALFNAVLEDSKAVFDGEEK